MGDDHVDLELDKFLAISAKRSLRPSAQRYSIAILRPSVQPNSRSQSKKAEVHSLCAAGVPEPINPTIGIFRVCCAGACARRVTTVVTTGIRW